MIDSHERPPLAIDPRPGFVVACEGLDGAGKSTQIERLSGAIRERGREVQVMRLNANRLFKQQCRLLNQDDLIGPVHAALMKAAELSARVEYFVKPLVERGVVVLWDKYATGSLAADAARGVPDSYLQAIHASLPQPELTLYLQITPEEALRRKSMLGGPRLMETGLEHQIGVSVRIAFDLWKSGAVSAEAMGEYFRTFQRSVSFAYEQFLPPATTVRLDATEPVEPLSARILEAVIQRYHHFTAHEKTMGSD
jgi:dTMP kinase